MDKKLPKLDIGLKIKELLTRKILEFCNKICQKTIENSKLFKDNDERKQLYLENKYKVKIYEKLKEIIPYNELLLCKNEQELSQLIQRYEPQTVEFGSKLATHMVKRAHKITFDDSDRKIFVLNDVSKQEYVNTK